MSTHVKTFEKESQKNIYPLELFIRKEFPFWIETAKTYPIPQQLLFDRSIPLNKKIFYACCDVIKAFWQLRQNTSYQNYIQKQSDDLCDPRNYSILMCYDFHVTGDQIKLIEVNTNAAFGIVSGLLNQKNKSLLPISRQQPTYFDMLKDSIVEEITRFGGNVQQTFIAIMDDDPTQQKAYFEFQYYKTLFEHWGWESIICDPSDLKWNANEGLLEYKGRTVHFVYNRCCDFLFEELKNQHLKQAFLSRAVCFSPNPYEYSLLAYKQRLIDLSQKGFLDQFNLSEEYVQVLKKSIPYSFAILDQTKEQIWSQRKNFFFKPKKLYGSKGVFRGASISKNTFASIYNEDFMVQEYIPPPVFEGYKYDLRIYAYKSDPQLAIARLYQGQVTNAHTPGGGLASIHWI